MAASIACPMVWPKIDEVDSFAFIYSHDARFHEEKTDGYG